MSLFRNTVWLGKGLKEYTNSGFVAASKNFNESDLDVKCEGRSYMITGSNSGIGKQTALEIVKRGGTVHMVCRNPSTGEEAKQELIETTGNNDVHLHILDLSKPTDVLKFARKFSEENSKLDVLVNNAGCMVNTRETNKEGLDMNFATNTLGTYLLTTSLLPLLEKSDQPRVITVSSGGMLVQKLDVDDLQFQKMSKYDGTMAYAQNKRQQVEMTESWSAKHPGIHWSVMHPGWADTPAVRTAMPDFHAKMKDKLRSVEQGADTVVWLAISPAALQGESGQFWQDRVPVSAHLPLAWTRVGQGERERLISALEEFKEKFSE